MIGIGQNMLGGSFVRAKGIKGSENNRWYRRIHSVELTKKSLQFKVARTGTVKESCTMELIIVSFFQRDMADRNRMLIEFPCQIVPSTHTEISFSCGESGKIFIDIDCVCRQSISPSQRNLKWISNANQWVGDPRKLDGYMSMQWSKSNAMFVIGLLRIFLGIRVINRRIKGASLFVF